MLNLICFSQARREALKYQLYRECYRELHENDYQFHWHKLLNAAFREPSAPVIPDGALSRSGCSSVFRGKRCRRTLLWTAVAM